MLSLLSFFGFIAYYNRNLLLQCINNLEEKIRETETRSDIVLAVDMSVMPANDYLITGEAAEKDWFRVLARDVEKGFAQLEEFKHSEHISSDKAAATKYALLEEKAAQIFAIKDPVGNKRGAALMDEVDDLAAEIIKDHLAKGANIVRMESESVIALAKHNKYLTDFLLVLAALTGVGTATLLGLYLIRSIVRPIDMLTEGASVIGSGDLNYRIDLKDGVEINNLVSEFNNMVDKLKESHARLEMKVAQRTSELHALNIVLQELSITDGLTGLYNHRYLSQRLDEEIKKSQRYNRPLSVMMIDIDFFKHYNDTNGHPAGDEVLKLVASTIKGTVRELDIVARYGGEEFCLVAPETSKDEAAILAERVRSRISEQTFHGQETQPNGNVTISIGVATCPDDATEAIELIKSADEALYHAKESGRDRVTLASNPSIASCRNA